VLAIEIVERIADFLFEIQPPNHRSGDEGTAFCCVKPDWPQVVGFMQASLDLHNIGIERWVRILTIRESGDWKIVARWSNVVRELNCLDQAFLCPDHRKVLKTFSHLRAISVDAHEDIQVDSANRFSYRSLFVSLPSSLRYLEIKHAHGPDMSIITMVKKHCPELEQLWLGRCTMFNRSPACPFWASFPFDHDSYISSEGTEAYTRSLGQELSPLCHLKHLRLGIYLMPSSAVLAHRVYHAQDRPAPHIIDWQQAVPLALQGQTDEPRPAQVSQLVTLLHTNSEQDFDHNSCKFCKDESYDIMQTAERNANQILKEVVPSLECVEWMDWFTPGHLGVSPHRYKSL